MSFYFNYKSLIAKDSKRNYRRFERLLIPYIFWPIIIYSLNNIFSYYLKMQLQCSFKKLIIQLVIGRSIVNTLWFQLDLILTTFLFLLIIYIFKKSYLFVLQNIMILFYLMQYTKIYNKAFSYFKLDVQISIGREIMMIPFAVTGFTLAALNIIIILQKYKQKLFIFSLISFFFIDIFNVFFFMGYYNGIKPNIHSISLIFLFSVFSFDDIKNKYIKILIDYITRYTAGIYYLHMIVHSYLRYYILCIRKKTVGGLFVNYIICYSVCHIGILLFGKTKAKNLFL